MPIYDSLQLSFIAIPKAASTTIHTMFEKGGHEIVEATEGHKSLHEMLTFNSGRENYPSFCIIRDPVERFYSAWKNAHRNRQIQENFRAKYEYHWKMIELGWEEVPLRNEREIWEYHTEFGLCDLSFAHFVDFHVDQDFQKIDLEPIKNGLWSKLIREIDEFQGKPPNLYFHQIMFHSLARWIDVSTWWFYWSHYVRHQSRSWGKNVGDHGYPKDPICKEEFDQWRRYMSKKRWLPQIESFSNHHMDGLCRPPQLVAEQLPTYAIHFNDLIGGLERLQEETSIDLGLENFGHENKTPPRDRKDKEFPRLEEMASEETIAKIKQMYALDYKIIEKLNFI